MTQQMCYSARLRPVKVSKKKKLESMHQTLLITPDFFCTLSHWRGWARLSICLSICLCVGVVILCLGLLNKASTATDRQRQAESRRCGRAGLTRGSPSADCFRGGEQRVSCFTEICIKRRKSTLHRFLQQKKNKFSLRLFSVYCSEFIPVFHMHSSLKPRF